MAVSRDLVIDDQPTRRVVVGGLVDPRDDLYVVREADPTSDESQTAEQELIQWLLAFRHTVVISPRQMGKSSLANYAMQELSNSHGFRQAWIDLDANVGRMGLLQGFIEELARQLGVKSPGSEGSLQASVMVMLKELRDNPAIVVVDELDSIIERGEEGETFLRAIRAVQQSPETRKRLVFCFVSVREIGMLFPDLPVVQRAEAPVELLAEPFYLPLFSASDSLREQLAAAFERSDPTGADNLALWVRNQSGGHPQLTMALIQGLLDAKVRYRGNPADMEAILDKQAVRLWEHGSNDELRFLQTPRLFLEKTFTPEERIASLRLYRKILETESKPDGRGVDWHQSAELYRLALVGLIRREGNTARSIGGFFNHVYDDGWAAREIETAEASIHEASVRRFSHAKSTRERVAIVITGGTIGMVERDGQVQPPAEIRDLEQEYDQVSDEFDVQWVPLLQLDSANVGPQDWRAIAIEVHARLRSDVAGVVVAHGTDTMAYTASAAAFALGMDLAKPVVFTGSQTTVNQAHGDARSNLHRACMAATTRELSEVAIVFGEHIFRAVRAVKRDDRRFDGFESFQTPPLGFISESVELQTELIRQPTGNPLPTVNASFADGILVIAQHPGQPASFLESTLTGSITPSGIIIQTLGAGNIPTEPPYDLSGFIREATSRQIPVLLASSYSVHSDNVGKYLPSLRAIDAGAIPVPNMTMAATVAKFSWVLGQYGNRPSREEVARLMSTNMVGEISPKDIAAIRRSLKLDR